MKKRIEETALKAYNSLGLRDYARVDIRLKDGIPYVIEINSLPGLNSEISDIVKMAYAEGISYRELVLSIVEIAKDRILIDPMQELISNINEVI